MSKPNEPAMPSTFEEDGQLEVRAGMTTRQAFVMAAMQGFLANPESPTLGTYEEVAVWVCRYADACLKREEETRVS